MIKGIDVSKWQGNIDWQKVKEDGIEFAIIRASYGKNSVDAYFKANAQGAQNAGVAIGAYHYCYATTVNEAVQEAEHFLETIKGIKFEYPVCLDLEDKSQSNLPKETITDIAIAFLETIKKAGYFPMIYANLNWFTNELDDSRLKPYAHWLAQWASRTTYSEAIGIWQYTSKGSVSGINGHVDMDYSYNDYAAIIKNSGLNGFTKGENQPVTVPVSEQIPGPEQTTAPNVENYYIVKQGDTLSGIAAKFNVAGGYRTLAQINKIDNPNIIHVGQKILISGNASPTDNASGSDVFYVVKAGDTLSEIAMKYNTTYQELAKINGIKNPNIIYVGQRIRVK